VAGGPVGVLDPDQLVGACTVAGVPGLVPHPKQSLALVPGWVLDQLAVARRGVVVLGVDGLSWAAAAATWRSAELACLTSTFPTISATAWMTALTGVGSAAHLVAGHSYLVPELGVVLDATTATPQGWPGQPPPVGAPQGAAASQLVVSHPTLFEHATQQQAAAIAVTRELDGLPGPWTDALMRGSDRWDGGKTSAGVLQAQAADPRAMAAAVISDVEQALAERPGRTLVWAYANLDDHVHRHGYDPAAQQALQALEAAATRWAAADWTVVAHADHGQVRHIRDQRLEAVWAMLDTPALCAFPGAGAGRTRWLYPRPARAAEVAERLRQGLGPHAVVLTRSELVTLGLVSGGARLLGRIGEVVALAASERFPLSDPDLRYEHGGVHPEELLVPLATWRSI
jgi:Type I phosphodiesterase / nucleotide pyrophosphatase